MDHKKSPIRRAKRQSKVLEDFWDCSVCTFRNTEDSFKCLMCDVRKGTSTRKPRLNSALVAQQAGTLPGAPAPGGSATATTTTATNGSASSSTAASPNNHHNNNSGGGGGNNHHYHKPGSNSSSTSSSSTAKMHRTGGSSSGSSRGSLTKHKHKKFARLKNVDRSTAQTREVTVNSVTVVITEYKPKPVVNRRESSDQSYSESNDSRS